VKNENEERTKVNIKLRQCNKDDFDKVNASHIYDQFEGNEQRKSLICPEDMSIASLFKPSDQIGGDLGRILFSITACNPK
jgi:hypothetical protein